MRLDRVMEPLRLGYFRPAIFRGLALPVAFALGIILFSGCTTVDSDVHRDPKARGQEVDLMALPDSDCTFPDARLLKEMRAEIDLAIIGRVTSVGREWPHPPEGEYPAGLPEDSRSVFQRSTRFFYDLEVSQAVLTSGSAPAKTARIRVQWPGEESMDGHASRFLMLDTTYLLLVRRNADGTYSIPRMALGRFFIEDGRVYVSCSTARGDLPATGPGQGQPLEQFARQLRSA